MKRALLVGTVGSPYLVLLKYLNANDEQFFEARESQDFKDVIYYSADVFEIRGEEDRVVLDVTGEKLKCMGRGMYYSGILEKPEIPLQMSKSVNHERENNNPVATDNKQERRDNNSLQR